MNKTIKNKKVVVLGFLLFLTLLLSESWAQVYARQDAAKVRSDQEDMWWKEIADTNKDGDVDDAELRSWDAQKALVDSNADGEIDGTEKRLAWRHIRFPVTTEIGRDFDNDESGWLEPEETRKLLFRTIDYVIRTNGRGPIRTGAERVYDSNEDGVIDLEEVKTLREDLR